MTLANMITTRRTARLRRIFRTRQSRRPTCQFPTHPNREFREFIAALQGIKSGDLGNSRPDQGNRKPLGHVNRSRECPALAERPLLRRCPRQFAEPFEAGLLALELALWDSVKDSSPAELESYVEQYPEGTFASLARTRLDAATLSPATPTAEDAAAEALDRRRIRTIGPSHETRCSFPAERAMPQEGVRI